jgi:hypothetical protein
VQPAKAKKTRSVRALFMATSEAKVEIISLLLPYAVHGDRGLKPRTT